jgi:hypothetical protein
VPAATIFFLVQGFAQLTADYKECRFHILFAENCENLICPSGVGPSSNV